MRAGIERLDNKATCPICLRRITVDESRYLRAHNRRASRRKGQEPELCPGSQTQPLDQGRLLNVEELK